jgi:hypothetical protein
MADRRTDTSGRRDALLSGIGNHLEDLAFVHEDHPWYSVFRLVNPPTADFAFTVSVNEDGEPGLSAQLVSVATEHPFWMKRFEAAGWRSPEDRDEVFLDVLYAVVNSRTRIQQVKGMSLWHFRCHVQSDDEWKPGGESAWGRWTRGVPRIAGRRRNYYSPRLVRAA